MEELSNEYLSNDIIHSVLTFRGKPPIGYVVIKINQLSKIRTILLNKNLNYNKEQILDIINDYAECSPYLNSKIENLPTGNVILKCISSNSNVIEFQNISREYADNVVSMIKSIPPTKYNEQLTTNMNNGNSQQKGKTLVYSRNNKITHPPLQVEILDLDNNIPKDKAGIISYILLTFLVGIILGIIIMYIITLFYK